VLPRSVSGLTLSGNDLLPPKVDATRGELATTTSEQDQLPLQNCHFSSHRRIGMIALDASATLSDFSQCRVHIQYQIIIARIGYSEYTSRRHEYASLIFIDLQCISKGCNHYETLEARHIWKSTLLRNTIVALACHAGAIILRTCCSVAYSSRHKVSPC
jgi:hypothetical protein